MSEFETMLSFERSRAGWLALAAILVDGQWHAKIALGEKMAEVTDLQAQSAANLLRHAHRAGYLDRRQRAGKAYFQVTPYGRASRPELTTPAVD